MRSKQCHYRRQTWLGALCDALVLKISRVLADLPEVLLSAAQVRKSKANPSVSGWLVSLVGWPQLASAIIGLTWNLITN